MDAIIAMVIGLFIVLILFLVFRELVCWYWKINKQVEQNDIMIKLLRQIANEKDAEEKTDRHISASDIL